MEGEISVTAAFDELAEVFAAKAVWLGAARESLFFIVFADRVVVGEVAVGGVEFKVFEAEAVQWARSERFLFWSRVWRVV